MWKEDLGKVNKKAADSLADPSEYENLFPEFQEALQAEQVRHKMYIVPPDSASFVLFFILCVYLFVSSYFFPSELLMTSSK